MKFKINQSFAANYDERRRKEELSKLKSKYGEVPLEEEDGASSTESETDDDWERNVLNDTRDLELLEALKSGDPRVKDPSYRWFSSSESESPQGSKSGRKERTKSLFLRDLERRRLIGSGKLEEEEEEEEEDKDQAMEQGDEGIPKTSAAASRNAFKINVSDDDDDDGDTELFSLGTGVNSATIASTDVIMKPTDKNADEVLLSYIKMIAKKANEPKLDHHNSSADDEREDDSGEEELFFSKGAEFEEQWNNRFSEQTDLESLYPRTFAAFRSEEADRDFIKSHPRTIPDSMRQPREGKLSRSEKNRARRDRVRREKEQKLARIGAELDAKVEAEIRELRRLKMETADDRVEKIRRTADNMKLQLDAKFLEEDWDPSKHDQYIQRAFDEEYEKHAQEQTKPVFSDDDELDEDMVDWDTWKPTGPASSAGSAANPEQRPQSTTADLIEVDEEEERGRRRRRKRRHRAVGFRGALERASKRGRLASEAGRFSREDFPEGFDEFIDKVYAFDCEDIIPGHGDGQEDVKCRFRYRSTVPNDFGLSVDEILCAPARELNSWASLKKVVQYRTEDEEARDKKIYGCSRRQVQKGRLLPTVFTPLSDNDGVGDEEEKTEGETVVRKKKKKKKQKKAALVASSSQQMTMETDAGDHQPRPKKAWVNKQKPYIPKPTDIVSESRLHKLLRANRE